MPQWDVIVVGAGLGGLSAAARLVQQGLRVLVLEKNTHPGGTAYVFTRKGFTFPMGPLGFSSPDVLRNVFEDLGLDHGLNLHRVHYLIRAFGVSLPISLPFSKLKAKIIEIFPEEQSGVERFFLDIGDLLLAMQASGSSGSGVRKKEDHKRLSAEKYLYKIIGDWRLRRILGSQGTREAYSSLPLLAAMWNLMGNLGIWYPEGGMRRLCEHFVSVVTGKRLNNGIGSIYYKTRVKHIRVEKGRTVGVILDDGKMIDAHRIISNADFKTTFLQLIPADCLPENVFKAVSAARQAGSVLQVSLGLKAEKVDLSAFDYASRIIYKRSDEMVDGSGGRQIDWKAPKVDPEALAADELEISLWSKEDPALVPDGGASVIIRVEADHVHFSAYRPASGRRTPSYFEYKSALGIALVRAAERIIPGLANGIQVMDVATPLTFEDRGGRSEGTVAGWSWNFEDNPDVESLEFIRTPVRGLYMAGYQAYSALFSGGIPTAVESGRRAADALLNDDGPVSELNLPGNTCTFY
jgi:phytoene dehydrogenase-like protein